MLFRSPALACVYVPHRGAEVAPAALRQRLAELLPPYMLPTRWKRLERLPLNPNGKVDRRALRDLLAAP